MPGHTNSSDPHEHGRPVRPKSGSTRKGTATTTSVLTKPRTNTNTSGTGIQVRNRGGRPSKTDQRQMKTVNKEQKETIPDKDEFNKIENGEIETMKNENDVMIETNGETENGNNKEDINETEENTKTRYTRPETPPKPETPPPEPPSPKQPDVFTLEKFNKTMDTYSDKFSASKFTHVTDDYPTEELIAVISEVTVKIDEYKQETLSSQQHLNALRQRMHEVKERIRHNIQQKSNAIRMGKSSCLIDLALSSELMSYHQNLTLCLKEI